MVEVAGGGGGAVRLLSRAHAAPTLEAHPIRRAAASPQTSGDHSGAVAVIVMAVAITSTVHSDPAEVIRNIAKVIATIPYEGVNAHK